MSEAENAVNTVALASISNEAQPKKLQKLFNNNSVFILYLLHAKKIGIGILTY